MMVIALGPTRPPSLISRHHHRHAFSSFSATILKPYNIIKRKNGIIIRAELTGDSPFYAAIGASVLSSLLLPNVTADDVTEDSPMTSTDTRLAVMGIVSFIPYFNWLSWVFAWLDTGKRRYGVYAIVYLLPYLRSNFSLYPEDSWLPIASIIFCIIHIQLEVSVANGDVPFQLFKDATTKKDVFSEESSEISKEDIKSESKTLSSGEKQSLNDTRQWGVPEKKKRELQSSEEDDWPHH
ncbi:hypothetical protein ACFE04_014651 [Oxalis oulophora]